MKSKKPFLIVCAAALTLALALPFMGVFAFADSLTLDYSISSYLIDYGMTLNGTALNVDAAFTMPIGYGDTLVITYYDDGTDLTIYVNSSYVAGLREDQSYQMTLVGSTSIVLTEENLYITMEIPPDPLAPVSDGMDTMISVFGDVIDYIINTPDVAIFVAISVASCAIIPMGIILIKKLIKGY